jgi:hypothetical protein
LGFFEGFVVFSEIQENFPGFLEFLLRKAGFSWDFLENSGILLNYPFFLWFLQKFPEFSKKSHENPAFLTKNPGIPGYSPGSPKNKKYLEKSPKYQIPFNSFGKIPKKPRLTQEIQEIFGKLLNSHFPQKTKNPVNFIPTHQN